LTTKLLNVNQRIPACISGSGSGSGRFHVRPGHDNHGNQARRDKNKMLFNSLISMMKKKKTKEQPISSLYVFSKRPSPVIDQQNRLLACGSGAELVASLGLVGFCLAGKT
jgi:hypothetical protein